MEVVWLYQRYNHKIPRKDSLKAAQHTLPTSIIDSITTTFNIFHSYFFSPITCSTQISEFYSTFARDKVFGSLSTAFQYKWKGIGYTHPHNEEATQQAIHYARLAAKKDPNTIIILVIPNINLYQNLSPHIGPFPDTHVITHFAPNTITYKEPIQQSPRTTQTKNKTTCNTSPIYVSIIKTTTSAHPIK